MGHLPSFFHNYLQTHYSFHIRTDSIRPSLHCESWNRLARLCED